MNGVGVRVVLDPSKGSECEAVGGVDAEAHGTNFIVTVLQQAINFVLQGRDSNHQIKSALQVGCAFN